MALGAEGFTVLAILEARDKASEIFAKIDESLDKFSGTAKSAADSAKGAGEGIDAGLGQAAPAADKLAAAQQKAAGAARELAAAERELKDAQAGAASPAAGAAEQDRLAAAEGTAARAARDEAAAQKELGDTFLSATGKAGVYADSQGKLRDANGRYVKGLEASKGASDASALSLGKVGKIAGITALGMGIAGGLMIKAAGNFQDSTTHLVTDAGESAKNLAMVQAGILNVSTATGTSAADITNAMYHIESSGMHGASGLAVLKIAAQGAKVGGADLDTVSKTLVGTLNAYGMTSTNAGKQTQYSAQMMNMLIATTGQGDMKMQDLASSLSAVAPLAAAAHIQFSQVGGAIATMTSQGMSARQSTQDLANTIRSLSNPNNVAINEMAQMGISSQDVSQHLGQRGLTGTISMLTGTILSHMGKSGEVLMNAFNQSKSAAADANTMIQAMPKSLQGLAKSFSSGSISSKQWKTDLQGLTPIQAHLMTQFATTTDKAKGFNSLLTSGSPAAQTYTAALAKMMGGSTGLNTALMLSGGRMSTFQANAKAVADAAKKGGANVDNWSTIQSTFNFKAEAAKTALQNTGIAIGSALLPAATRMLSVITKVITPIAEWTAKNKTLTEILFVGVTAIAATIAIIAGLSKAYKAVSGAVNDVKGAVRGAQSALQKLGLISKKTAGEQETAAKQAAATQETAAAEGATAQETAAAEGAGAQETAAAESSASWVSSAATTIGAWASAAASGIASAASWVAAQAVKVASVVASNVAGAASTAAAWIASAASGVASAAVWVAGAIAKVAIIVAANVAGAVATAAAWVIANAVMLLGIGLIVAAIVIAVVLIVKYWKQISDFAVEAFHKVLAVVDTVIGWIKAHWPLVLAILTGPIGLAVLFIIDHWHQIMNGISAVISWVKAHWPLILAIITGPIGLAVLFIVDHWKQIVSGAEGMIHSLVSFFTGLPGRILGALGDLSHLLWNAGISIINGLIGGLESMLGALGNTASSVAGTIKSFLPFSPAKRGPLSGSGAPENSGQAIARNLARGMLSGSSYITSAAHQLAGSAALGGGAGSGPGPGLPALGGGGYGGGGGSGVSITIDLRGAHVMSDRDIDILVGKIGPVLTRALGQAGVKVRFG